MLAGKSENEKKLLFQLLAKMRKECCRIHVEVSFGSFSTMPR
jgi:hypothetical protein